MTLAAKITYFTALFIGLSIGAFFGFKTTAPMVEAYYDDLRITAPMVFSHFSCLQYSYADAAHAKAALYAFAGFLEELEKLQPEQTQERELAFTYARLAVLEEVAEKLDQSHALMAKARFWYSSSGLRDYSESEMKAALKRLDERAQP
jgi:hypothetical protein